jgi:hypothetical protein
MKLPQQRIGVTRTRVMRTSLANTADGYKANILAQQNLRCRKHRDRTSPLMKFTSRTPNEGDVAECFPASSYFCLQFVATCVEAGCGPGSVGGGKDGESGYFCDCGGA